MTYVNPDPQPLAAATADDSATQHQAAVTAAPQSTRGALGFFATAEPKQGATMVAPSSPQGVPGFAVVPQAQGVENIAPPASPQGPPGFCVTPGLAPQQGAPVMAPPQGVTMMAPQQQHFAPAMVPGSQQVMQMLLQALQAQAQAQAQAMVAHQPAQGMAPSQCLPMCHPSTVEMQQAQAGHVTAPPPVPLGPPLMMQQQQQPSQADTVIMAQPPLPLDPPLLQQQQPSQADTVIMAQPPLPLGSAMLQQQPPQGATMMMAQPPLPLFPPSVMLQHNPQGNQVTMAQPQFAALPCKRQRLDQYDNNYGQHMTGHQEETAITNAAIGQFYGPNIHNGVPYFGAPEPSLPPDATNTIYVEGLPINCTRREVAHIFRQYMGFLEMRLVNKGSNKHLCFVDFATPAQAFFAMRNLQGYKFDEQDPHSRILNLQFSRSPRMGSHGLVAPGAVRACI
eukprot:XP_008668301.1 uncharacterized protein LOC100381978 isoform X1 [Zea mays]